MTVRDISAESAYWSQYQINEEDLESLYNVLLERAEPLTAAELLESLVKDRIDVERKQLARDNSKKSKVYLPKNTYTAGEKLKFPQFNLLEGEVLEVRPGQNPDYPEMSVIGVRMADSSVRRFASNLAVHALNDYTEIQENDPKFQPDLVLNTHGESLLDKLKAKLEQSNDVVSMEEKWFPKALLVDINQGYLNLAEALLEMENGGPVLTKDIIKGIDLPNHGDEKLVEFSLNYAMASDPRFDDVGPSGDTLWYLNRLEPEAVLTAPRILRTTVSAEYDAPNSLREEMSPMILDELEANSPYDCDKASLVLIYPHWRCGTLPLCDALSGIFPTAIQSSRIRFDFRDTDTGEKFPGWVVRDHNYIYGLRDWFLRKAIAPGGIIEFRKSSRAGEIDITAERLKTTRDWVRTVTVNEDGNINFSMMKQLLPCAYDPRLVNFIQNPDVLDAYWVKGASTHSPIEKIAGHLFRELGKLNHQGQVHAEELYAAVNIVKRVTPTHILNILQSADWATYAGNLYFHLK